MKAETEAAPTGLACLTGFSDSVYLPWYEANKSAATANGYKRVWENYWKPDVGGITLTELQTAQVTAVLDKHAKDGKGSRTLSHNSWMLSGVYVYAIANGVVPKSRVPDWKRTLKLA